MKSLRWILSLLLLLGAIRPASAQQGIIVRDNLGLPGLKTTCLILKCKVSLNLGDPKGQVFLISVDKTVNPLLFAAGLLQQLGIVDAELDRPINLVEATAGPIPESLLDQTPIPYIGAPVWNGYANQPAAQVTRVFDAQTTFNVHGAGIVAMIDTGVDTQHPVLVPVLVPGYNFIDNTSNGSETGAVNQSSAAVLDGAGPVYVNQSTVAFVNQSSAAVLDGGGAAFGHGTMTAGIVHLVAPTAQLMPLKAFDSDGSGYLSNIVRAMYYAAQHGSKVISMSFSFEAPSAEMSTAIQYAGSKGIICVASTGNDGANVVVYPAGISGVMGVASTSDYDTRSTFSNYGSDVWVAAPGEGIISTYPYGTYSAGWGTSFSAPFVSGTAALLVQVSPDMNQQSAASAIAHAVPLSTDGMGNGRLDIYQAVRAWVEAGQ